MHADLVHYWIRVSALLILPIVPHFSEHIWLEILREPVTVQKALWPAPSTPPDQTILDAGAYVRGTLKSMREAEVSLLKKMGKSKGQAPSYDLKKPKSVRIYVATSFPEWQETCVQLVKLVYDPERDKVDDSSSGVC